MEGGALSGRRRIPAEASYEPAIAGAMDGIVDGEGGETIHDHPATFCGVPGILGLHVGGDC